MAVCPFADQSHRYDSAYGGSYVPGPWRGVLHTTETTGLPGYGGGATAPHATIDPRRRKFYQHFDTARPARALKHPSGTVETNNLRAVQYEIVAYSDEAIARKVGGVAVSQLTGDDLAFIARCMRWAEQAHGIQPTSGLTFKPYPASAGAGNGVRMSSAAWLKFGGWCGHQHVPNNVHGDPSSLPIGRLLTIQQEDIVATLDELRQVIQEEAGHAVWSYDQGGARDQAWAYQIRGAADQTPAIAAAVKKLLPSVGAPSTAQLTTAIRTVFREMGGAA